MRRIFDKERFLETLSGGILIVLALVMLVTGGVIVRMFSGIWTILVLIAAVFLAIFVFYLGANLCIGEINFDSVRGKIYKKLHLYEKEPEKKNPPRHPSARYYSRGIPISDIPNEYIVDCFEIWTKRGYPTTEIIEYWVIRDRLSFEQKRLILKHLYDKGIPSFEKRLLEEYECVFYEYTESPLYPYKKNSHQELDLSSDKISDIKRSFVNWMIRDGLEPSEELDEARKHLPLKYVKVLEDFVQYRYLYKKCFESEENE